MKPLSIAAIAVVVVIVLGVFFFKGSGTNQISTVQSPPAILEEKTQKNIEKSHTPTYQERLNSMGAEDCKNVKNNPSLYPPEIRNRCSQVFSSTPHSTYAKYDEILQELEETYLFTDHNFEDLYARITDDMLTPEALENCAYLWEDMVQKTTSVNKNNLETISPALKSQSKFSASNCYATQDKWHE